MAQYTSSWSKLWLHTFQSKTEHVQRITLLHEIIIVISISANESYVDQINLISQKETTFHEY